MLALSVQMEYLLGAATEVTVELGYPHLLQVLLSIILVAVVDQGYPQMGLVEMVAAERGRVLPELLIPAAALVLRLVEQHKLVAREL